MNFYLHKPFCFKYLKFHLTSSHINDSQRAKFIFSHLFDGEIFAKDFFSALDLARGFHLLFR